MFHKITINTMDSTLISDSEYLFALCITDGLLEEMDERQRSLVLLTTAQMLRKKLHADSDRKTREKYQNNEGCQNKAKVSK